MDERLKMFTTNESRMYGLNRPWHYCGWDYATDGAICVRVPVLSSRETEIGNRKVPMAHGLFDALPKNSKWLPWPEIQYVICSHCDSEVPLSIMAGRRKISGVYADMIAALGDAFYCDCGLPDQALAFRASGGLEGRVMPVADA